MQHPFFSIIMPVYNVRAYLARAIDSVLRQTDAEFELILVDDASTDGCGALCDAYARADRRVTRLRHAQNRGLSAARNTGYDAARGTYVLFMDADDQLRGDALSVLRGAIWAATPDVLVFGLTERYEDGSGAVLYEKVIVPEKMALDSRDDVRRAVMALERRTLFGYAWNKAYRAEAIRAYTARFEDVVLIEDFLFNIHFFDRCESAVLLDQPLYVYTIKSAGNLTAKHLPDYFALNRRRVEALYAALDRWGCLTKEAQTGLARIYVRYAFSALMRNCDPRTGLKGAGRKEWLRRLYQDPLYERLRPHMGEGTFPAKALGWLFAHRWGVPLRAGAWVAYLAKVRLPGVFARVKQG